MEEIGYTTHMHKSNARARKIDTHSSRKFSQNGLIGRTLHENDLVEHENSTEPNPKLSWKPKWSLTFGKSLAARNPLRPP